VAWPLSSEDVALEPTHDGGFGSADQCGPPGLSISSRSLDDAIGIEKDGLDGHCRILSGQLRYLEQWELVRPFTRASGTL
jgi:hypothetical protein